jgi:hypothetical protein
MHTEFWLGNLKEGDQLGYLDVDESNIDLNVHLTYQVGE